MNVIVTLMQSLVVLSYIIFIDSLSYDPKKIFYLIIACFCLGALTVKALN